jgi:hypothetical protein
MKSIMIIFSKKMIKINKKDSIIDIIIKIGNCKQKEIVLDFPF